MHMGTPHCDLGCTTWHMQPHDTRPLSLLACTERSGHRYRDLNLIVALHPVPNAAPATCSRTTPTR